VGAKWWVPLKSKRKITNLQSSHTIPNASSDSPLYAIMSTTKHNPSTHTTLLNLIQSHLVNSTPPPVPFYFPQLTPPLAQSFTSPPQYTTFHHPLLTALPPATPTSPHPTEQLFLILRHDEKVSPALFASAFAWAAENVDCLDAELGGRVRRRWEGMVVGVVYPDSTVAYYKVFDGVHKPLEGTAGV